MAMKRYRISNVRGDRYAGEWPRERFRVHGIEYRPSDKPKSDLYRDLLPAVNSGLVDLLDHERLTVQLTSLERKSARGGRDSIDHPPGGRDDVANAVAGALVWALQKRRYDEFDIGPPGPKTVWLNDEFSDDLATANWRAQNRLCRGG
jgi:hypothetical protein